MSTVDPDNLRSFTDHAQQWWDESGPFKPLHHLNPVRLAFIREEIITHFQIQEPNAKPYQGLQILDIGCGGGLVCEPLYRLGASVTGIDAGAENIEVARAHAQQAGFKITYHATTAEDFALNSSGYDVVTALEIVEHVADLDLFICSCLKLLKPGGLLILSTLNRTLKSYLLGIVAAEYLLKWVPRGTHNWQQFLEPAELATYLEKHSSQLKTIKGMSFNPLSRTWHLSDDLAVNYLMAVQKPA
jgi:ubiquinone biosynthesis O-methyltransferase